MQTLTIDKHAKEIMTRAADKARAEKPKITKTATPGVYTVNGKYTVTCNSTDKTITCTCKAIKPCYHIAAVADYHSWLVKTSQEAAPVAPAAPALANLQKHPFTLASTTPEGDVFTTGFEDYDQAYEHLKADVAYAGFAGYKFQIFSDITADRGAIFEETAPVASTELPDGPVCTCGAVAFAFTPTGWLCIDCVATANEAPPTFNCWDCKKAFPDDNHTLCPDCRARKAELAKAADDLGL